HRERAPRQGVEAGVAAATRRAPDSGHRARRQARDDRHRAEGPRPLPRQPRAQRPQARALLQEGRGLRMTGFTPKEMQVQSIPLFHLAFPVDAIAESRRFYGGLLGCAEGRSSEAWVDFNFYGHQIVAHLSPEEAGHRPTNAVDGEEVPVRHFGAILPMAEWESLAAKLKGAG